MSRIFVACAILASACLLAGCASEASQSAGAAQEIKSELKKPNPNVPDMPEPPGGIPRGDGSKGAHTAPTDGK